jgi:predicted amino acid-binding ACT domain protein
VMSVDWSTERNTTYPACVKIECMDRVGIAGDILKKVSDNRVNLRDLRIETNKAKKTATIVLMLEVVDVDQLQKISQAISQISDVIRVHRSDHKKKTAAPPAAPAAPKQKASKTSNVTPINKTASKKSPRKTTK